MFRTFALAALILLGGCGNRYPGDSKPITMRIVNTYEDKNVWGCIGTNWTTTLRSEDGRVGQLCGKFGSEGDVVVGCWVTGAWDSNMNGFRMVC